LATPRPRQAADLHEAGAEGLLGGGERDDRFGVHHEGELPGVAGAVVTDEVRIAGGLLARLVEGYVTCQVWEAPDAAEDGAAHGVYQVLGERTAHSRFEVVTQRGLTPLVGREVERGLLRTRWAAATGGLGQVVVIM